MIASLLPAWPLVVLSATSKCHLYLLHATDLTLLSPTLLGTFSELIPSHRPAFADWVVLLIGVKGSSLALLMIPLLLSDDPPAAA